MQKKLKSYFKYLPRITNY